MDDRRYPHGVVSSLATDNARDLERELSWFAQILQARLTHYFAAEQLDDPLLSVEPPHVLATNVPHSKSGMCGLRV